MLDKIMNENQVLNPEDKNLIGKYAGFTILFTFLILIFSLVMAGVASYRNSINDSNYENTTKIYGGTINQSAPTLNEISSGSRLYKDNNLDEVRVKNFVNNTNLTSTDGNVTITADFVKKGLMYQPSFKTDFYAKYTLKNNLNEKSFITFAFPFPINSDSNEISNARLVVNGEEVKDAKNKITYATDSYYGTTATIDGLKWEGDIKANEEATVEVYYHTVGLASFVYEGIENSKGAQDFNFKMDINGTRLYDVMSGLSVDRREFGSDKVTLIWEKSDLYSKPYINIAIGEKLNPSTQVSRIYFTMAPIFLVFMVCLLYLSYAFGKKMTIFDMFLVTVLYTLYFPFIHYLSSFTIDPTIELFSKTQNAIYYSMPLYGAFLLAWLIISALIFYLMSKISNVKFAGQFVLPTLVLFLGFFPLVVTVPEYSMLMVIIGAIALTMIVLQIRTKRT